MPVVHIDILKRPVAAKRAMVREVTDAIVRSLGVAPESVCIVVNEMSRQQYAVAGALLADQKNKKPKKTLTKKAGSRK